MYYLVSMNHTLIQTNGILFDFGVFGLEFPIELRNNLFKFHINLDVFIFVNIPTLEPSRVRFHFTPYLHFKTPKWEKSHKFLILHSVKDDPFRFYLTSSMNQGMLHKDHYHYFGLVLFYACFFVCWERAVGSVLSDSCNGLWFNTLAFEFGCDSCDALIIINSDFILGVCVPFGNSMRVVLLLLPFPFLSLLRRNFDQKPVVTTIW